MLSKRHIALAMSAQAKVSLGVWPTTKRKQPMRHVALGLSTLKREPKRLAAQAPRVAWAAPKRKQTKRQSFTLTRSVQPPDRPDSKLDDSSIQEGGLQSRSGSFLHKDPLGKSNVPALATAGDQDLICPPEAEHGSSLFHLVSMHL
ncbi:hypothetical protein NC652_034667 [Populus alba x Populus x berolinensis]|nr:hypothetical protein NC652_034667 [Populus alba x Populus x berolinensis]